MLIFHSLSCPPFSSSSILTHLPAFPCPTPVPPQVRGCFVRGPGRRKKPRPMTWWRYFGAFGRSPFRPSIARATRRERDARNGSWDAKSFPPQPRKLTSTCRCHVALLNNDHVESKLTRTNVLGPRVCGPLLLATEVLNLAGHSCCHATLDSFRTHHRLQTATSYDKHHKKLAASRSPDSPRNMPHPRVLPRAQRSDTLT